MVLYMFAVGVEKVTIHNERETWLDAECVLA